MKIRIETLTLEQMPYVTVGYWKFTQPLNGGDLIIQVLHLKHWRNRWAVIGHELIEALWCKLRGITTETCDQFDNYCDLEMVAGRMDPMKEPGFDKRCPYRVGHILGCIWEYACIFGTGGWFRWKEYNDECDKLIQTKVEMERGPKCCRSCPP